jgi:hypothetical protein
MTGLPREAFPTKLESSVLLVLVLMLMLVIIIDKESIMSMITKKLISPP